MDKTKMKKVLLPALAAVAFAGVGIGSTFALFTDKAEAAIEIEAGIVDIQEELEIVSVSELGDVAVPESAGVYTNSIGGQTYVDPQNSGVLHLEKWVPGDKVVLTLKAKNLSNVSIKTRFAESHTSTSTPDLYDALDISYAFAAGYTDAITEENFRDWTLIGVPTTENKVISTLTITIEFPDTDDGEIVFDNEDNEYRGTNCAIAFTQEAVQGNAHTPDTSKGYADSYEVVIDNVTYEVNELSEPEHIEQMLEDMEDVDPTDEEAVEAAQKTIFKLDADIDMEGSEDVNRGILYGTLDGDGHTIENFEYEDTDSSAAGLFAKYYDGATVKNLTIDNASITGKENVGILFGESYAHAAGASSTVPGSELTLENVVVGENVVVSGTKGVGGIAGSTRWVEKLTLRNCVNNADVAAEVYNVGGFFGTLAGVKTLICENCVNNGNIRGPHNVGGFVGQSPALTSITLTNCVNNGRIIDFSSRNNQEANAGWFVACCASNCEFNYTGNVTNGALYYVTANENIITVFEKDLVGDTENAGIRVPSGKTYADYMIKDDSVILGYEIVDNLFNVTPVAGADHYTISMLVWGRDVTLSGNTATVYKEKYLACTETYDTVAELHDDFGRITRAGYFLNSQYTEYDYVPLEEGGVSQSSTMNGRANFFRLPYAQKASYAAEHVFNRPSYDADLHEWVYLLDGEADCLPGTGHIMSPKNTGVTYVITAYDSTNHVIANCVHNDTPAGMNPSAPDDVSGSYLKNMAGDTFWSASPGTTTGDKVYDPVA